MFVDVLKVYFLNFRYFFIAKKQQVVLYSYITYREIENNQPGSGAFARGGGGGGGGADGHCWN